MIRGLLAAVVAAAALAGCGPTCQSTCTKLYSTADGGCGLPTPGRTFEQALDDCMDDCEYAIVRPGELGDYDPTTPIGGGQTVTLENEKQAAAWMDCVEAAACERLDDGFCPPN
jgi:hypothetical protein